MRKSKAETASVVDLSDPEYAMPGEIPPPLTGPEMLHREIRELRERLVRVERQIAQLTTGTPGDG